MAEDPHWYTESKVSVHSAHGMNNPWSKYGLAHHHERGKQEAFRPDSQ